MAQRVNPSVSNTRTQEYLHTKRTVEAIKKPKISGSDCCFCFPNCDWDFPAFADITDQGNTYTNDRVDFIFNVPSGGTLTAKLIELNQDNSVKQEINITDNTYGTLYPLNNLKTGVWAFLLDWYKVATVEGFGRWKFNVVIENSSSTEIFNQDSVCWRLEPYSCQSAHRTVKIRTRQSGYFEGGFDYSGIEYWEVLPASGSGFITAEKRTSWGQEIRLYGRFFRQGFDYNIDNIVTEERGQQMVQSQTIKRYLLKLDTIPTKLSNRLIEDMLQAPEILISDYQVSPIELYEDVRVTMTEIGDPINFTQNKNEFFEITFQEWKQDNIHRYK